MPSLSCRPPRRSALPDRIRVVLITWLCLVAATVLPASALPAASSTAARTPVCTDRSVRVALTPGGPADQSVYGRLCVPEGRPPSSVQLLVPGMTYTHLYWDVPGFDGRYSYVRRATAAGYATFAVDTIGTGRSSYPASERITIDAAAYTLHQVITALRAGRVAGTPFRRVVYVGHSLGSGTGWLEVSRYRDVDAFVPTGTLHAFNAEAVARFRETYAVAADDPRFADRPLDPGYITTADGARPDFFYHLENADPAIVRFDERHKDVISLTLSNGSGKLAAAPPEDSVTQGVTVPVLAVTGEYDVLHCGGTGGADCSDPAAVARAESRYYSAAARPTVVTVPDSGHDLALQRNAPQVADLINTWLLRHVRP
ncbi:alpha/beta hydrolase [Streptomyces sp. 4F14]|uniref:alpha/beta hydrolase n=1 Tax=Streptomyces sp. 4F14 TaxID=3394380 RepID=UPI003A89250C